MHILQRLGRDAKFCKNVDINLQVNKDQSQKYVHRKMLRVRTILVRVLNLNILKFFSYNPILSSSF